MSKTVQQILDEVTAGADPVAAKIVGKFCDELSDNGWVFIHKSQIAGKPPKEHVLTFPDTPRGMNS